MNSKLELLRASNFGERIAEEEVNELSGYFVETEQWRQIFGGKVDVVYGAKGSGKSALYSLLRANSEELLARGVRLETAEKPRGSPVFKDLVPDPPISETEFVALWKLYIAIICAQALAKAGVENASCNQLVAHLTKAKLWEAGASLSSMLTDAFDYVKHLLRKPQAVEGTLNIDPISGMPNGISGKIMFSEPNADQRREGIVSVDTLLNLANEAMKGEFKLWILLDRLDVAFTDHIDLEKNALRALFRAYLDGFDLDNISLKIFLRTDIWERITDEGFREASHITKHVTIQWNSAALLNLVVRRVLHNEALCSRLNVGRDEVLASADQQNDVFYRIFPKQVDVGPNKPYSFDWMLSRTADGTKNNVPRELIHLLNEMRSVQVKKMELGEVAPDNELLFSRAAFKEALPEVSRHRLQQTLLAEYPKVKPFVDALRKAKTEHTPESLAAIWNLSPLEAKQQAEVLREIGLFEPRGNSAAPRYWVPFLYRDALDLVQGSADTD